MGLFDFWKKKKDEARVPWSPSPARRIINAFREGERLKEELEPLEKRKEVLLCRGEDASFVVRRIEEIEKFIADSSKVFYDQCAENDKIRKKLDSL